MNDKANEYLNYEGVSRHQLHGNIGGFSYRVVELPDRWILRAYLTHNGQEYTEKGLFYKSGIPSALYFIQPFFESGDIQATEKGLEQLRRSFELKREQLWIAEAHLSLLSQATKAE